MYIFRFRFVLILLNVHLLAIKYFNILFGLLSRPRSSKTYLQNTQKAISVTRLSPVKSRFQLDYATSVARKMSRNTTED